MSVVPPPAIGEVVDQVPCWTPRLDDADGAFTYVDLSAIDQDSKTIASSRRLACADAPSRARQIVRSGDVLVSTVRPILNAVGRVPVELDGATASTGFCVLRPRADVVDGAYLFHWVRSPRFVGEMVRRATGASYPAVSGRIVYDSKIPLPSLAEQKQIAGILDAAEALRAKRREALAELDTLFQSTFLGMFGDPVTNPMGWDAPALAEFCRTGSGGTPSRKKMKRYYEGGTIPWVKSGELREEVISRTSEYITQAALKETNVKLVPKDALLLALYGATVGRLGILGTQATTNQAVCHIIPNSLRAEFWYMFHCLSNQVSYLVGRGVGGAQPNISQGLVKSLTIPLPPLDLQHRFATIVKSAEQMKARQRVHLSELNTLFASLQSRAFRGDL